MDARYLQLSYLCLFNLVSSAKKMACTFLYKRNIILEFYCLKYSFSYRSSKHKRKYVLFSKDAYFIVSSIFNEFSADVIPSYSGFWNSISSAENLHAVFLKLYPGGRPHCNLSGLAWRNKDNRSSLYRKKVYTVMFTISVYFSPYSLLTLSLPPLLSPFISPLYSN